MSVTNSVMFFIFQLMCKLNVDILPQVLVEQYLIEIAKNYNVPYKYKATIMVSTFKKGELI